MLLRDPFSILLTLAAVLIASTCHEFAHALVADRLGDPTPRNLGRLSLNPVVHLDPLGTLLFVVIGFGWARPVPVNARNFSSPRQGMLQVAAAGPLANVTVALLLGALLRASVLPSGSLAAVLVSRVVWINVILALFNLIPIPPLDGSRIMEGLLPPGEAIAFSRLQPYGVVLLILLLTTGVVRNVIVPAAQWLYAVATSGSLL